MFRDNGRVAQWMSSFLLEAGCGFDSHLDHMKKIFDSYYATEDGEIYSSKTNKLVTIYVLAYFSN